MTDIDILVILCKEEVYAMAWLAKCEVMTNGRDIYSTGIFEWSARLDNIQLKINNLKEF